jgi:hypothetical protein
MREVDIDATLASMGRLGTQQGELGAEENLIGRGYVPANLRHDGRLMEL